MAKREGRPGMTGTSGASFEAIRFFLDDFREELMQEIGAAGPTGPAITRTEAEDGGELPEGLTWWAGSDGGEPTRTLYVGGEAEAWEAFGSVVESDDASARFGRCLERALEKRFGRTAVEGTYGWTETPGKLATKLLLKILNESSEAAVLYCCFSRDLENALSDDEGTTRTEPSRVCRLSTMQWMPLRFL